MATDMGAYPVQKIVFFVAQDVDQTVRDVVVKLIGDLSSSRKWLLGSPKLVDTSEDHGSSAEDAPITTLGGELEIYSALGPVALPKDIDSVHFSEVSDVVEEVRRVSEDYGLAFEFEIDGTFVGTVEDGAVDKVLRRGLLEPWQEHLGK